MIDYRFENSIMFSRHSGNVTCEDVFRYSVDSLDEAKAIISGLINRHAIES